MLFFKNKEHKNVISRQTKFTGIIQTESSITIKGEFTGKLEAKQEVYIATNAEVEADIIAENLFLEGKLKGEINLQKEFEIEESAEFSGEITAQKIIFHKGAELKLKFATDITEYEKE